MPVAELLFSATLPVLFERLTSPELLQFLRRPGLDSKIKDWQRKSLMIQAVLADAEEKQLTNPSVKMWLDELQELVYDVEDLLDEFVTEGLARELKKKQPNQASTSKVQKFVRNFSPRTIKLRIHMESEIEDVTSRFERLCKLRADLGLQENRAGGTSAAAYQRLPTTSVPTEPAVCGRDDDKRKILEMVFSEEPSVSNFRIISIFGMGGIGKSTLAREVYHDKAVGESFQLKVWACVSNDFDVIRISKAILESITGKLCDLKELDAVQKGLQQEVAGKKFLLVLDDVWSKNYNSWETLMSPFKAAAGGSKIIVTTRHSDVATTMGRCTQCYQLKFLSDNECWSLFKAHAFDNAVAPPHPDIDLISQKVIQNSKGLPLASKTLGGLLGSKQIDEWLKILNSKMWDLVEENDIPATLKLSYYYLPSHLKML